MANHLTEGRITAVGVKHLQLLSRKLVDAACGRCPRLAVSMPPRHGKSETASKWFPAWYLSHFPDRRIILAAHTIDYAESLGRAVRDNIRQYQDKLGIEISSNSSAAGQWDIAGHLGGMKTAGINSSITGRGADLFMIDDPIKGIEEANSPKWREHCWEWWQKDARTRFEPGCAIVLVMTRWHEDDLLARILRNGEDANLPWEVINLPAIAGENDPLGRKPGQALWPQRYDEAALAAVRSESGEYTWDSLFQGKPPSVAGGSPCDRFNYDANVDEGVRFVRELPLQISIDFNRTPGMHAILGQHFPGEGLVTAIDEIHDTRMTIEQMIAELKRRIDYEYGGWQWPILEVYGDASGSITSMADGKSNWDSVCLELEKHDIPYEFHVPHKNPGVVDTIIGFNYAFRDAYDDIHYKVNPRCKLLIRDFRDLKWDGKEVDKTNKIISHAYDAERYRVAILCPMVPFELAMESPAFASRQ